MTVHRLRPCSGWESTPPPHVRRCSAGGCRSPAPAQSDGRHGAVAGIGRPTTRPGRGGRVPCARAAGPRGRPPAGSPGRGRSARPPRPRSRSSRWPSGWERHLHARSRRPGVRVRGRRARHTSWGRTSERQARCKYIPPRCELPSSGPVGPTNRNRDHPRGAVAGARLPPDQRPLVANPVRPPGALAGATAGGRIRPRPGPGHDPRPRPG